MKISLQDLRFEAIQRREERCDGSAIAPIEAKIAALGEDADNDEIAALYDQLDALAPDAALEREEPSDLPSIRRLRPNGPRTIKMTLTDEELSDRVLGAWLARAAGCTLGKPVEGWKRRDIEAVLRHSDDWPLSHYFVPVDETWTGRRWHPSQEGCLRGNITRMVRDDDMDYTLLGLHIMERYGPEFTTANVGETWLIRFPYHQVYTAERSTYRNLVVGLSQPEAARYRNPYREWIGAQIRADFWGYVAPGEPERAAEFAYRDAALSHVKNGIYGEMWMAATLAAAFATTEPEEAIRIGMSEIPARCRLAQALDATLTRCRLDGDWERTLAGIGEAYGGYDTTHTINNAALVALGLMYGKTRLGPTICTAVVGGWDTDCNGASAGSVCGAMIGANALPYEWVGPLNDTLDSSLSGLNPGQPHRFTDLARRTVEQIRRVRGRG